MPKKLKCYTLPGGATGQYTTCNKDIKENQPSKKEVKPKKKKTRTIGLKAPTGRIETGVLMKGATVSSLAKYNNITVPDLNLILIKLGMRKADTSSTNSGGTKSQKIKKIVNAKGGKKMLDDRLKAGKGIKSKDEQKQAKDLKISKNK